MNKRLMEFIFLVVLICIMVMSLNMAIADSTGMSLKFIDLLKYTCLTVLIVALMIKYPISIIGAVLVAAGGALYAIVKDLVPSQDIMSNLSEFFTWLPQFIIGYQPFELKYSLLFAILYILFATLVITLIVFNKRWYSLLIVLGVAAFAFFWFIYVTKARLYMMGYLSAALILYSYNVYERKKAEWVKSGSGMDKNIEIKWILNSLLITIVSIMLAQVFVIDIKPVQWSWLSEKALQTFPFIQSWRNDNIDGFSFGFNSKYGIDDVGYRTAKLGGPVTLTDKVMLIVETKADENIYLRGTVKDNYTGINWKKTKKSNYRYSTDADLPLPFGDKVETYKREVKVINQTLITSTIFAPNTLSRVQYKSNEVFLDEDSEATIPGIIPKKESYTVVARAPYVEVQQLRMVKTKDLPSQIYKQLPDNIPVRVIGLAKQITKGKYNDYDKAKAIEKYLRSNFKYTLTPPEVPANVEFVDHFLFESKEGYCTYFATAMAVLLRACDIPCRYVEGFLVKDEFSNQTEVRGTDAHAWVEVNFGEYGWLVFEATPAYPLQGYRSQGEVPAAPIPAPIVNEPAMPSQLSGIRPDLREREPEDVESEDVAVNESNGISASTGIILAIIAILIFRILYLLIKRAYLELQISKAQGREFAVYYFKDILRFLSKLGVNMESEETLREYWFKIRHSLDESYKNGDEVLELIERLRYSKEAITEVERKQLEEYRKKLKKFVTSRLGTIKALVSYYIIGL